MEQTNIIVLVSIIVLVLAVFFFGVRSTTKTIDKTLQEAKNELYNNTKLHNNSRGILGGSRSKLEGQQRYLTKTNAFILFTGLVIGYILSHFS